MDEMYKNVANIIRFRSRIEYYGLNTYAIIHTWESDSVLRDFPCIR